MQFSPSTVLTEDVAVAQRVFEELSITIASMGKLKLGGAFKGPGREYCEGFVAGLFEQLKQADTEHEAAESTAPHGAPRRSCEAQEGSRRGVAEKRCWDKALFLDRAGAAASITTMRNAKEGPTDRVPK